MYTTVFTHKENNIVKITHDFGNGVTLVADFNENSLKRFHGKIMVEEYDFEFYALMKKYANFLINIDMEVNHTEYSNK